MKTLKECLVCESNKIVPKYIIKKLNKLGFAFAGNEDKFSVFKHNKCDENLLFYVDFEAREKFFYVEVEKDNKSLCEFTYPIMYNPEYDKNAETKSQDIIEDFMGVFVEIADEWEEEREDNSNYYGSHSSKDGWY